MNEVEFKKTNLEKAKYAIVVVYFGPIPKYLNLFLKGLEYNSSFDFFFFTDWNYSSISIPLNFKGINLSIHEFNKLSSSKLNLDINIKNGYKLCDLKPAWPLIFEDYLSGYEYVGWCDIDLIFGDITAFLPQCDFDLFTITTEYVSGAFSVIKNSPLMRNWFKKAKGWDFIFTDERHFAFDEYIRLHENIPEAGVQSYSDVVINSNDIIVMADKYIGYEHRPAFLEFRNGKVFVENQEFIFFHLVGAKRFIPFVLPNWEKYPDIFYINRYGFFIDPSFPLKLSNLFFSMHYLSQMYKTTKSKIKTLKKILKNLDIKNLINIVKDQL